MTKKQMEKDRRDLWVHYLGNFQSFFKERVLVTAICGERRTRSIEKRMIRSMCKLNTKDGGTFYEPDDFIFPE